MDKIDIMAARLTRKYNEMQGELSDQETFHLWECTLWFARLKSGICVNILFRPITRPLRRALHWAASIKLTA